MPTDWPGHECYLHTVGPGIPKIADRYYPLTECHPPPFWQFSNPVPQTDPLWAWLDLVSWLQWDETIPDQYICKYNVYITGIGTQFRLRYIDNPDFGQTTDQPWRVQFDAVLPGTFGVLGSKWRATFDFGAGDRIATRPLKWTVRPDDWYPVGINNPTHSPPEGIFSFEPRLCQQGWRRGQLPR